MNAISLCAGIGGIDIAAEWAGIHTLAMVELDKVRRHWLGLLFPDADLHDDIDTFNPAPYSGTVDIIFGGEPCQGNSIAGDRKGFSDPRYKWPQYFQIVKVLHPAWVVNENVRGSISNGVLDQKILDLESIGYTCWPPLLIPAGATGALHRRDRVFLVAYSLRSGCGKFDAAAIPERETKGDVRHRTKRPFEPWPVARYTSVSQILLESNGLSEGLPASYRNAVIEAAGNAVMPQHIYPIFQEIMRIEVPTTPPSGRVSIGPV